MTQILEILAIERKIESQTSRPQVQHLVVGEARQCPTVSVWLHLQYVDLQAVVY